MTTTITRGNCPNCGALSGVKIIYVWGRKVSKKVKACEKCQYTSNVNDVIPFWHQAETDRLRNTLIGLAEREKLLAPFIKRK